MTPAPANPRLTVAMSVYNDGPYVGEAIDSILQQSFADFEFLIIDDRSTDNSAAVIAQRAAQDARITVLESPEKGRVPALNALFAAARAPWVAIMDSDDISMPDRFAQQMAKANSDTRLGVIGCSAFLIDAAGRRIGDGTPKPVTHEDVLESLEDKPLVNHNAVLIRREPVLELGGYHRAYRHAEDYDLWLRLVDRVRFANLPEDLVAYRVYADQVSTKHVVEQTANAAISWQAYLERQAGRPDPTGGLTQMPALEQIDELFGRSGVAAYARRRIVNRILFSAEALATDGYRPVIEHVGEAGPDKRLWRACARLLRAGYPVKASGLARALLVSG